MKRKQLIYFLAAAILAGALGGIVFDRGLVPRLSTVKGFGWLQRYVNNAPIIITRREEIVLNEGANFIELAKQASSATVSLYQKSNLSFLGNGIILSSDGLIFTSKSAVGSFNEVLAVLNDGSSFTGLVRAFDPKSNLAVLTIEAKTPSVLPFAEAHKMLSGQKVLTVGQLNKEFGRDFLSGFIVRSVSDNKGFFEVFSSEILSESFVIEAGLNRGFLGSPLINLEGRLIGMVDTSGRIIISENIQTALSSYLASGKIARPRLGATYIQLSAMGARLRGLDRTGALIVGVEKNSAAHAAGIIANDLIYQIDGQEVGSFEQILNRHPIGEMKVKLLRGKQELEFVINLEATK
ncbi:MAG: serine protease [Candidatus Doudnabacteria bacterium]|nr:serine protease [Candidatus Doudnabacteria bacterium]